MNIEDLAKDGEKGKPLKKKGYDDVEISDLSDSGNYDMQLYVPALIVLFNQFDKFSELHEVTETTNRVCPVHGATSLRDYCVNNNLIDK
ncbi:unnamed protein product [Heligmosomoides polygyrus]|uniref:Transposase n=1 Tax=Heligmosomoides polygyrus TaxID=6339 RepID=A0A183G6G1_HELPZ|nr:unnamed protein product [Heligmosomoides polygyrus]